MRYQIIRRKTRVAILFILLVLALAAAGPYIYKNIFVREEDFVLQDETYEAHDLYSLLGGAEAGEDISIDVSFLNDGYIFSGLMLEELNLKGMMLSANLVVKGKFIKGESGEVIGFSGKLFSKDTELNSNPFMDARMSFKVVNDEFLIKSLRIGQAYELKGKVSLISPFETDLRLEIDRADIRDFAVIAKIKNPDAAFGIMSGAFDIKGPLSQLFSDGAIHSKNGKIGPVEYDLATVKIEGFGPIMNIVDSSVMQDKGSLVLEGYIDLRNIEKGDLFDGLRVKSDLKTIAWYDWDITKKGLDELSMTKDISDDMRIGFRTMARDPSTTYYDRENPEEMSLEYRVGMENLKMKLRENEEFFGIEHKIEF